MADDKLAKFVAGGDLAQQIPEVKTLAKAFASPLLAARHEIKRNPKLQRLFCEARKSRWSAAKLSEAILPELLDKLNGTTEELQQTALYLADEYEQIGDGMLIISTGTGKAIAKITDADIWQPPDVPREGGSMAKPLPRLRPDLEGFLVQWSFDEERDYKLVRQVSEPLHQTALQREEGDNRLLPLTRAGRQGIAQSLQEALPTLLGAVQGLGRLFLENFSVLEESSESTFSHPDRQSLVKCSAMSRVMHRIPDPKAINLRHDKLMSTGAQIAAGWVRDMAYTLAHAAKEKATVGGRMRWPEESYPKELEDLGVTFWVGPPDFARALSERSNIPCLPVEGVTPTGLSSRHTCVGNIVIDPKSYDSRSREVFDRWEVAAVVEYTLYIDWYKVVSFEFDGLPIPVAVAEVVA